VIKHHNHHDICSMLPPERRPGLVGDGAAVSAIATAFRPGRAEDPSHDLDGARTH
jgi:hypothetical protein